MAIKKGAKQKWYIGTNSASLASESAWVAIEQCYMAGGANGVSWGTTDATTFDDDYKQDVKTIKDAGDVELALRRDVGLAGQVALRAAALDKSDAPYNFKCELDDDAVSAGNNPTTIKFQARVLAFTSSTAGVSALWDTKAKLALTSAPVETAAAA